jgi:hypothetical protein
MAELIDGAVQQAAHPGRQSMAGLSTLSITMDLYCLIASDYGLTGTRGVSEAGRYAAPLWHEAS